MKKMLMLFITISLVLLTGSCSKGSGGAQGAISDDYAQITLSQEDKDMLDVIKADIITVTDGNYIETVNLLNSSSQDNIGKVYQLEGTFTYRQVHDEKMPYVYRKYAQKSGETVEVGMLLNNMTVFPDEGDWVKITGIMSTAEHDGHAHPVLDIVTVETPAEHGNMIISE